MVIFLTFLRYWTFFATRYYPRRPFWGFPDPRSIFLVVLDGPSHVSYTLIIHYMVIFLTVFEILDILSTKYCPLHCRGHIPTKFQPDSSNGFLCTVRTRVKACLYRARFAVRRPAYGYGLRNGNAACRFVVRTGCGETGTVFSTAAIATQADDTCMRLRWLRCGGAVRWCVTAALAMSHACGSPASWTGRTSKFGKRSPICSLISMELEDEEDLFLLIAIYYSRKEKRKKRNRKHWVHPINMSSIEIMKIYM